MHKGAKSLLWGELRKQRGGNPPAPAFPGGETGKGRSQQFSPLPQAEKMLDSQYEC